MATTPGDARSKPPPIPTAPASGCDVGGDRSGSIPVVWPGGPRGERPLAAGQPWRPTPSRGYHLADRPLHRRSRPRRSLAEANRLAAAVTGPAPGVVIEPGSQAVRSLFRLHETSELFRNGRSRSAARSTWPGRCSAARSTCIRSRINFKPALDGKEFFWHSDFETWHVEDGMPRMRAVSVSLFLTPSTEFNGPLLLVPGSHQDLHPLRGRDAGKPSREVAQEAGVWRAQPREALTNARRAAAGMVAAKGPAGTAVFFECNTMHGSAGNL